LDTHANHKPRAEQSGKGERGVSDSIYIGDMHGWSALRDFAERRGYAWFSKYIEPEWLAWFIEVLKQSDDDDWLFPHGKWATIQHLQGKVAAMAAGERYQKFQERVP
jgi:hypothetical protein